VNHSSFARPNSSTATQLSAPHNNGADADKENILQLMLLLPVYSGVFNA
jgi:hypothetical protein